MGDVTAPLTVTEALTGIALAGTAIGLVGAAVVVVHVGIKVWHWVRRAM